MLNLKGYNLTPEELATATINAVEAMFLAVDQEKAFSTVRTWENPEMIRLGEDIMKGAFVPADSEDLHEAAELLASFITEVLLADDEDDEPDTAEN